MSAQVHGVSREEKHLLSVSLYVTWILVLLFKSQVLELGGNSRDHLVYP